jgi:hypothetical protein
MKNALPFGDLANRWAAIPLDGNPTFRAVPDTKEMLWHVSKSCAEDFERCDTNLLNSPDG